MLLTCYLHATVTQVRHEQRVYDQKLDAVNAIMSKLKLPPTLRARIQAYYYHVCNTHSSFDMLCKLNSELSTSLVNELSLYFHRRMIAKVVL